MSADPRTLLSVDEMIATLRVRWLRYVLIRSWHVIDASRDAGSDSVRTFCGRVAVVVGTIESDGTDDGPRVGVEVHPTADTLPAGRSCESCLRAVARKVDA